MAGFEPGPCGVGSTALPSAVATIAALKFLKVVLILGLVL